MLRNALYVSDAGTRAARLVELALKAKGFEYGRGDQALLAHNTDLFVELDSPTAALQYLDKLRPEPALLPHHPLNLAATLRIVELAIGGETLPELEERLRQHDFVLGPQPSAADLAMHVTAWNDLNVRNLHLMRCMEAFEEWRDELK